MLTRDFKGLCAVRPGCGDCVISDHACSGSC
nr:MAG TPA: hypothetical protein [Caudoviricetes sp.]